MIQILGISHNTANLHVREKFSFTKQDIVAFSNLIQLEGEVNEIVILSTCNRTEFYFTQNGWSADKAFTYILDKLKEFKCIQDIDVSIFYRLTKKDAVQHLFKVSSGLDSMLYGEDQIIGQVKEAYIFSTEMGYTDAILMRLFQKSFEAGKRVRSETSIKIGTTSISHLAVEIVKRKLNELGNKRILVIGAGKAAELIITALKKNNVSEILIANRSIDKAETLLKQYPGKAIKLDNIITSLPSCDAVISASGAQRVMISEADLNSINTDKEQLYVDISVPLSIEKPKHPIEGMSIYQIDDLRVEAKQNAENRKKCQHDAEKIIDQVTDEYINWHESRVLRPAIKTITSNLQTVGLNESLEYQKGSTPEIRKAIEAYNNHITQKYTRAFIKNLKDIKDSGGHNGNYIELVERLFKIST